MKTDRARKQKTKIWTANEIASDKEGYSGKVYRVSDDTFNKMREKCMDVDYLYVGSPKKTKERIN